MGGVAGGLISLGGAVISSAASALGADRAERDYYRSMAATAEAQAKQVEETTARNIEYTAQDAAYQSRQLAQDASQLLGQQKTRLASNGVGHNSATAQLILKNSRLNAQLDQEMLASNLQRSIYEISTQGNAQAAQYRQQAKQYKKASRTRGSLWAQAGSMLSGFVGGLGSVFGGNK